MEDPPLRPATPPRTPPQPTTSNESLADPGPAPAEPAQFPGLGTGRPRDQIPEHDSRVEAPMELALPRSGDQGPLAADYSNTDYWRSRLAGQTHLHATKEFIGDSDSVIRALSEALKGNTMLRSLLLPRNNIGPEGARQLAEALKWNSVLKDLDLSGNSIGDVGATALAELLKGNTALFSLGLAANSIGPEGARALAEALKGKSVLRSLTLSQNSIGHEGAGALAEALKGNSVLEKLDLHGNSIGDDCASALADLLNRNKGPPKRLRSARQQSSEDSSGSPASGFPPPDEPQYAVYLISAGGRPGFGRVHRSLPAVTADTWPAVHAVLAASRQPGWPTDLTALLEKLPSCCFYKCAPHVLLFAPAGGEGQLRFVSVFCHPGLHEGVPDGNMSKGPAGNYTRHRNCTPDKCAWDRRPNDPQLLRVVPPARTRTKNPSRARDRRARRRDDDDSDYDGRNGPHLLDVYAARTGSSLFPSPTSPANPVGYHASGDLAASPHPFSTYPTAAPSPPSAGHGHFGYDRNLQHPATAPYPARDAGRLKSSAQGDGAAAAATYEVDPQYTDSVESAVGSAPAPAVPPLPPPVPPQFNGSRTWRPRGENAGHDSRVDAAFALGPLGRPPEGWGFVYFAERTTMVPHIVREHAGNVDDPERVRLTCGRCGKQYLGELKGSTFMKDHSTPGTCFNMVPRTRKRRRPADPSSASLPAPGGPRTPTPEATESRRIRTGFSEGFGDVGRDAMGMAKSGSARGREKPESLPSSDLEHLLTLPERSESRTWPANLAVEPLDPAGREGLPAFLSPPLPPDNNIHLHRLLELSHGFSPDDREFCMQFLPSLKLIIPRVLTILGCRILPAPRIRPGTVLPPTALFPGFDAGAASTSSGLFAWAHGPLAAEQVMCAAVLLSEQGKVLARGSLMMAGIGSGQGAACAFEGENWTRGSEAAAVALVFWRD